jgi:hypothetical protein
MSHHGNIQLHTCLWLPSKNPNLTVGIKTKPPVPSKDYWRLEPASCSFQRLRPAQPQDDELEKREHMEVEQLLLPANNLSQKKV